MELTKDNFDAEIASGMVLVDFWAEWCGPCQAMMPIISQFEQNTGVKVGKVNVDEQGELAGKFRVMSIPTFQLYKEGKLVDQFVGSRSLSDLEALIAKHK